MMDRYDEQESYGNVSRQKDIVLATNEYCHVLSKTNGNIKTYTGPVMLTISQQESLVVFNPKTKRFDVTQDFEEAKQLFVSAPESWYVVLKNPTKDKTHPEIGTSSPIPDLEVGKKINIFGPTTFSLYPGQMAKVIQGHRLRSNQYLLARVYDAEAAQKHEGVVTDIDGETKKSSQKYFQGQLLVIKGTEVSFYIPPTGIEVIPIGGKGDIYVRDAVTLERLEYAILKDENGEKVYKYGPAVVFPEPTQTFVETAEGGCRFKAIELSKISGVYVKVIAAYKDENGKEHPAGEELFITGNDQMIYYPRPEHTIISYDGKYMHHAIAIPKGEGRYIMNRETGEIKTVIGHNMYLPDPRYEVVVKRKLSERKCRLWYPNNNEVIDYNNALNERSVEKELKTSENITFSNCSIDALFNLESKTSIDRGTSYTKPRIITLDNKYDGVVRINVWAGYAVSVLSNDGKRKIVTGPDIILLDYDENLEPIFIDGKELAYLQIKESNICVLVPNLKSLDGFRYTLSVKCSVDFDEEYKDKWFSVSDYGKLLSNKLYELIQRTFCEHTIDEIYNNYEDMIDSFVQGNGILIEENGMRLTSICVNQPISIQDEIKEQLYEKKKVIFNKTLQEAIEKNTIELDKQIAEYQKVKLALEQEKDKLEKQYRQELKIVEIENEKIRTEKEAEKDKLTLEAKKTRQIMTEEMDRLILALNIEKDNAKLETEKKLADIEQAKMNAYSQAVKEIVTSVSPELTAALTAKANVELTEGIGAAVSPYAMARGESVGDTVSTLLRGTPMEQAIAQISTFKTKD